ncbi:MAG: PAS domain-containing protein, partial [Anaerolineae bacterium]|nr:PAS domain-containing protein [Anaerolineae bacterium]
MKTRTQLPDFSLFRRRTPGLAEMEALMDMLPRASILVNSTDHSILLANAKATELTAFTRIELSSLKLNALFPE